MVNPIKQRRKVLSLLLADKLVIDDYYPVYSFGSYKTTMYFCIVLPNGFTDSDIESSYCVVTIDDDGNVIHIRDTANDKDYDLPIHSKCLTSSYPRLEYVIETQLISYYETYKTKIERIKR